MKISISYSSVSPMLEFLKNLKAGTADKKTLHKLLLHEDYQVEFQRYGVKGLPIGNITQSEFETYLMNCLDLAANEIENPRLRIRHADFVDFINHVEDYQLENIDILKISEADLEKIETNLQNAFLPEHLRRLDEIKILVTVSIGNSFGWPYENYIHFDFTRILKLIKNKPELIAIASHEIHHIIYTEILRKLLEDASPLLYYLLSFSYEGLAEKFNNNAIGKYSKKLYDDRPKNLVVDETTWKAFAKELPFMMKRFESEINAIKTGKLNKTEVDKLLMDYWVTPNIVLATGEVIEPMHYRSYYFGNELFGSIYDRIGLEGMFEILDQPDRILQEFFAAVSD